MIGADEAGRGPWAGPLVVVAVRLRQPIHGLDDSKRLSVKKRRDLAETIQQTADISVEQVPAATIDRIGLGQALYRAYYAAIERLAPSKGEDVIVDGAVNYASSWPSGRAVVKADQSFAAVSAASIVAKVTRDTYMLQAAALYPGYGFERHVGYGTARHRQALMTLGICPEHRRSVKPVAGLR